MYGNGITFVVGCPRSGTTHLQRLLTAHPRIDTRQESHLFYLLGPVIRGWHSQMDAAPSDPRGGVGLPCYVTEEEFLDAIRHFVQRIFADVFGTIDDGRIFVEKSPSHALYLDAIHEVLPEAKVIHIVRDARDVTASLLAASRGWGQHWAPKTALRAARLWRRHIVAAQRSKVAGDQSRYCEVTFERLIEDGHSELKRLFDFLEVKTNPAEIAGFIERNSARNVSEGKGTEIPVGRRAMETRTGAVIEPEGFVRRGSVGSWRSDLRPDEKAVVWAVARSTMSRLGYRWSMPW